MTPLADLVTPLMATASVPGVAVGVLQDGREELVGIGVTNLDHPLPVTPDTLFQVGSVSKTIAATAVLQLVEQGRLDLDLPVLDYLPDLRLADREVTAKVTLRHLLTHSAGFFGDDFVDTGEGDDALARAVAEMGDLAQLTPLGVVRSYCNSGFALVGRVLEVVTGRTYEAAVGELVFRPAGMDRSFFFAGEVMTHRFVVGHVWHWDAGRNAVATPWPLARSTHPAGGVIATVRDLLRYARLHLGDAPGVLAMRVAQPPLTGMVYAKGLGWALREVAGVAVVEHGGATLGQICMLALVPARGFAVAVLTNSSRGPEVYNPLVRSLLAERLGLDAPEPQPIQMPDERLRELEGSYQGQLADYDVGLGQAELVATTRLKGGFPVRGAPPGPTPPPMHLRFFAVDRLVVLDGPARGGTIDVLRDANGRVEWLRIGGRVCRRLA